MKSIIRLFTKTPNKQTNNTSYIHNQKGLKEEKETYLNYPTSHTPLQLAWGICILSHTGQKTCALQWMTGTEREIWKYRLNSWLKTMQSVLIHTEMDSNCNSQCSFAAGVQLSPVDHIWWSRTWALTQPRWEMPSGDTSFPRIPVWSSEHEMM